MMSRRQCERTDVLGHTSHSTCWIMAFTLISMRLIGCQKCGAETCIQELDRRSALKVATLWTKWNMRTSSGLAGYGGVRDWLTSAGCGTGGVVPQDASTSAWACQVCAQVRLTRCDSLKPTLSFCDRNSRLFASKRKDPPRRLPRLILKEYFGVLSPGWSGPGLRVRMCGAVLPTISNNVQSNTTFI